MSASDAMKFRVVDFGRRLQRAEDYSPANLQSARIDLGKGFPGEVRRRNQKLFARQTA